MIVLDFPLDLPDFFLEKILYMGGRGGGGNPVPQKSELHPGKNLVKKCFSFFVLDFNATMLINKI